MSRLLTDAADLAGYAEPGTAQMDLDALHIARQYLYALTTFIRDARVPHVQINNR